LQKRIVRIYPSYIIIFSSVYLLAMAFASTRNTVPHDAVTLIKSILLLPQDTNVVGGTGAPVIVVAWTLQYEMIFYAAIGFAILNRYLFLTLILIFLVNFGICAFQSKISFPQSFFANDLIILFLFGMMAAYVAKSKMTITQPIFISIIAALAFISVAVMEVLYGKHTPFLDHNLAYGIISGILIVGLVRTEDHRPKALKSDSSGAGFIPLLGDASYALYLIHLPLISLLSKLAIKVGLHGIYGALIAFFIILNVCIFAALAFHCYIERPILLRLSTPSRRRAAVLGGT
jgi:exopolysaccharide production protein ExoZ